MEVGEWSISSPASALLGALWSERLAHGWVHLAFSRISPNQLRVIIGSVLLGTLGLANRWLLY